MLEQDLSPTGGHGTPISLRGRLELRLLQPNSRNHQPGVYLVTPSQTILIRPANMPGLPHNALQTLAGREIIAHGHIHHEVFLAEKWEVINSNT